jgi:putative acetyltransferase
MISVAVETPLQDDVRILVSELNEALLNLTPREHCHHLTVEQMADVSTTVLVARDASGAAVGCGALKRHAGKVGEVKRMYTRPSARGAGVGRAILGRIEELARQEGLAALVLETGNNFEAAQHIYRTSGFAETGPLLDYPPSPWTASYEKRLT